ncbi:MAG: cellulase family glycosylhydrolase, partial [Mediterranea sp.]|nr:cellulase family glycosylhydrolase [Mediterranea sp.]
MERLKSYLLLLLISTTACGGDNPVVEPEMEISAENGIFFTNSLTAGEMTSYDLYVKSNVEPQLTSDQSWCSITSQPSTSATMYKYLVKADKNPTTDERIATITVRASTLTKSIQVTQAAAFGLIVNGETSYEVPAAGESITIQLQANGVYDIDLSAAWITRSTETRALADHTERFVVSTNTGGERTGSITFSLAGITESISVKQEAYGQAEPDLTGMENDAVALAKKMYAGWNLYNTLEATGGETAWGNPKTTQALIDAVKGMGFNAIRIPCAWHAYIIDDNYTIDPAWMQRVKEVVDYCMTADVYAILNIHWDGGWLENNCIPDKQEENNLKQHALWTQIAAAFREYDERLLFAGCNEPNVENAEQMAVLKSYEQTFVDAVRATGGRNYYRNLIIQGPSTDITKTNQLFGAMPEDVVPDRLMAEVHYYTPWNFCGLEKDEEWYKMVYFWGKDYHVTGVNASRNATEGEAELDALF